MVAISELVSIAWLNAAICPTHRAKMNLAHTYLLSSSSSLSRASINGMLSSALRWRLRNIDGSHETRHLEYLHSLPCTHPPS